MKASAGLNSIVSALRNPNYGIYTAGSAVSLIGTWTQRVAVGWLAWQLTQSGAWLGAIAFADLFPTVVIGPIAGAAADRWDRLRLIKTSQSLAMLQSLLLFALTVTGQMTIGWLLALSAFLGVVAAFNQPARLALIPSLVSPVDLTAAVAINSIIFNAARFIGPAVAGFLIVGGGVAAAFGANALSFAAFLFALSRIKLQPGAAAAPMTDGRRGFLVEIVDGVRYALLHPGIGPLLLLMVAVSVCARPFVELLPGFAAEVFATDAGGLALMTSTIGIGAVLGGLWLAQRGGSAGLTTVVLGHTLVLALALLAFVSSATLWIAVLALAIAGWCMVAAGVGTQTLLQLSVEPAKRGRVLSLYGLIFRGGPAVGALAMGGISEGVGLRWPLAVGAGLVILAVLWIARQHKQLAAVLE
jgi:predicted MFS family arabinose efflux permease